jgi:polyhydroxybutyrate depolymerase
VRAGARALGGAGRASQVPAPVSVIHIHGTADRNIPCHGGTGQGFAHIDGPPIPLLNASWRSIDRCAAPSVRVAGVVTTSVARCPPGCCTLISRPAR